MTFPASNSRGLYKGMAAPEPVAQHAPFIAFRSAKPRLSLRPQPGER